MSTIAQNLQTIATAKANIATSINNKGGSVTSSTPLSAYSAAIDAIPSGGGGAVASATPGTKFSQSTWTACPYDLSAISGDMSDMFKECGNLVTGPQISGACTDASGMFFGCASLVTNPQLNTSACTSMTYMFCNCGLATIPQLNTSSCTDMSYMFNCCRGLTGGTALASYDFSNVRTCTEMFSDSIFQITTLPVMNTSACTNFWAMLRFNSDALTRVEGIYLNSWEGGEIFGDWVGDPDDQQNHPNLTYVMLYNLGMSEEAYDDFDLSCLMDWGDGGSANHQSLIDSLYTNAYDRATAGYETRKIKLHPYTYARLSQQEIDNIESKGYEVVDIMNE